MKELNDKDFDENVKDGVSLVDFYATWCMPCRMFAGVFEEIEDEIGDKVKMFKVDVDENSETARKFGVMSIPTIVVLKDGKMVAKHVGVWTKDECIKVTSQFLN